MRNMVARFGSWRKPSGDRAPPPEDPAADLVPDPAAPYDAPDPDHGPRMTELAQAASKLGFGLVDIAAFLFTLRKKSHGQMQILARTRDTSDRLIADIDAVCRGIGAVSDEAEDARARVDLSAGKVRLSAHKSRDLAQWVASVSTQIGTITDSLSRVQGKSAMIEDIAFQVNVLAINAGIEASRAGEAGRGFAVIAQTIKELSDRTNDTAEDIRESVHALNQLVARLAEETGDIQSDADRVIDESRQTDANLAAISEQISGVQDHARRILTEAEQVQIATEGFLPAFAKVTTSVQGTTEQLKTAMERVNGLNDRAEFIVQKAASMGGEVEDAAYIRRVMQDATTLSQVLEEAVAQGRISLQALFSRDYRPIRGSDPPQVMAPFTRLTDQLFPPVQEAALSLSDKVVFCAAVNVDGYLPTHNLRVSHPQGPDPEWNAAHCRNRRIFDDRVGRKAGRNREPFLLQVYRRDMGGGTFRLMKDVSAPILVQGRHWGGLRLAYGV
ncbi:MAG: chemotaxis protein [Rhodobacteraceae bacterium]|nr:MAG: chemotaxis protein [Paracoccaceae bacterium]